ncbi:hypothetical protein vseg_014004 [Gypsophila vaccaria]
MLVSMKIQPIDGGDAAEEAAEVAPATAVKPVVMSRLRRLFRISAAPEKDDPPPPSTAEVAAEDAAAVAAEEEVFEPSSVCLARMVQNFIEESNEKSSVRCGRSRCSCFNGSDGSDGEVDNSVSASLVSDYLKRLVVCASVDERNLVADTARVVAEKSKGCKRKDELRKLVMEGLMASGYDAAICKSKWEKSPSFPAGEYEYVDVIVGGERLIIDIDFRSEFVVAKSTKTYKSVLQTLPNIFVGKPDRLSKIICILSEAAKQSLKKKGMHIPPWRKAEYVQAKWLSPPIRLVAHNSTTVTPPPSPITPVSSHLSFNGSSPNNPISTLSTTHFEIQEGEKSEANSEPAQLETVSDMSESSGVDDVNVKLNNVQISPKKRVVTGFASVMEDEP